MQPVRGMEMLRGPNKLEAYGPYHSGVTVFILGGKGGGRLSSGGGGLEDGIAMIFLCTIKSQMGGTMGGSWCEWGGYAHPHPPIVTPLPYHGLIQH